MDREHNHISNKLLRAAIYMSLIIDNENIALVDFIQYVESLPSKNSGDMLSTRVIPSFLNTVRRHDIPSFSQKALTYWAVDMALQAMKTTTIIRYLGAMHTLYRKFTGNRRYSGKEEGAVAFSLPDELEVAGSRADFIKKANSNLRCVNNLSKSNRNPDSQQYTYANALKYLLINPEAALSDVVDLRFSDPQPDCQHIEDIKLSMRKSPQAKYVFPLEQGKRRKPAIIHDLLPGMHAVARKAGLDFGETFSRDSLTSIWIAAALKEDILPGEIREIVRSIPPEYSMLALIEPVPLSPFRRSEILNRLSVYLMDKTTAWYVMRLRAGVSPDDVKKELKARRFPMLSQIQFYYPQKTVRRLVKKKAVATDIPILPGILFFRIQYDRIANMMRHIGKLAWCYRTSSDPSSPYSAIPQREMMTFQRSVGAITADIEMEIISGLPDLKEGDEVVIENGTPFDGQHAIIRKIRSLDGTTSCTLRLTDSEFIHWEEITLPASSLTMPR